MEYCLLIGIGFRDMVEKLEPGDHKGIVPLKMLLGLSNKQIHGGWSFRRQGGG